MPYNDTYAQQGAQAAESRILLRWGWDEKAKPRFNIAKYNDDGPNILLWGDDMQDLYMVPHKNHRQRYKLYLFLVGNGYSPTNAKKLVLYPYNTYDADAHRQIDLLIRDGPRGEHWYWDLELKRRQPFVQFSE